MACAAVETDRRPGGCNLARSRPPSSNSRNLSERYALDHFSSPTRREEIHRPVMNVHEHHQADNPSALPLNAIVNIWDKHGCVVAIKAEHEISSLFNSALNAKTTPDFAGFSPCARLADSPARLRAARDFPILHNPPRPRKTSAAGLNERIGLLPSTEDLRAQIPEYWQASRREPTLVPCK